MQLTTNKLCRLDATGFANGDTWNSEKEIRKYFTVENFDSMFPNEHDFDQDDLDYFADYVIEKQLHCHVTYSISDGNATQETDDFNKVFDIVNSWYDYLQEEHDDLSWDFSYFAKTVDEINENIADMENEIAEQLGHKNFQGHGNYSVSAASEMGLNLTVTAHFPKE